MNFPELRCVSRLNFGSFDPNLTRISTGEVEFDERNPMHSCESDRIRVYGSEFNGERVVVVEHAKEKHVDEEYSSTTSFESISKHLSKFLNFSKLICIGTEKFGNQAYSHFVMDGSGRPLDDFLDKVKITMEQRNHLVKQICKATDDAIAIGCGSRGILCADIFVKDNELEDEDGGASRYDAILGGVHKYKVFDERHSLGGAYDGSGKSKKMDVTKIRSDLGWVLSNVHVKNLFNGFIAKYIDRGFLIAREHPYFWDTFRVLDFYRDLNALLVVNPVASEELNNKDPTDVYNPLHGWGIKIQDTLVKDSIERGFEFGIGNVARDYGKFKKTAHLVRAIRNGDPHIKGDKDFGPVSNQVSLLQFYETRFPALLHFTYKFVSESKNISCDFREKYVLASVLEP